MTPAGDPTVTVVVLTWNGRHLLDPCLTALRAQDVPFRAVVVDNASVDGTAAWLAAEHPWVEVVLNPANLGFAAGNNAALRQVTTPYAVLLNNDAVPQPGWLAALLEPLERDPEVAAVTSRMLLEPTFAVLPPLAGEVVSVTVDGAPARALVTPGRTTPDPLRLLVPAVVGSVVEVVTLLGRSRHVVPEVHDVVQNAGVLILGDGSGGDRGYGRLDGPAFGAPAEVFGACGGAMALRTAAAAAVGWFDERWFLYYEDTDLSWRLRAAGHRVVYAPGAVVRHAHGATTSSVVHAFHDDRNRLMTLAVNAPRALWLGETLRHPLVTLLLARRGVPVAVRVRAYRSYLRFLPSLVRSRRGVRRSAVVAAAETAAWRTTHELWLSEGA